MRDAARRREATTINTKCDALLAVHNVRSSVQRRAVMKGMIAAMLALAASGYAAGVAQERPDGEAMLARFATLPPEARALAERLVLCGHLAASSTATAANVTVRSMPGWGGSVAIKSMSRWLLRARNTPGTGR